MHSTNHRYGATPCKPLRRAWQLFRQVASTHCYAEKASQAEAGTPGTAGSEWGGSMCHSRWTGGRHQVRTPWTVWKRAQRGRHTRVEFAKEGSSSIFSLRRVHRTAESTCTERGGDGTAVAAAETWGRATRAARCASAASGFAFSRHGTLEGRPLADCSLSIVLRHGAGRGGPRAGQLRRRAMPGPQAPTPGRRA